MPSRTTGKSKCKETLQQVKERLIREQANRTSKRIKELLDSKEDSSDLDRGVLYLFSFIWIVLIVLFYARLYLGPKE